MSYRLVDGQWEGAVYSNVATGETSAATAEPGTPSTDPAGSGIWIDPARLATLPTSGSAWNNVVSEANSSCGTVDLESQDQDNNVCIMAKALVFARGQTAYRTDVVTAITQIVEAGTYGGRWRSDASWTPT